ncbi:hypothetical protein [Pedobacter sp.]|uniref:hypothetical protein n=1 Tax=Pedobacter sp. TaxID=1411316 RepID=UPI00396CF5BE
MKIRLLNVARGVFCLLHSRLKSHSTSSKPHTYQQVQLKQTHSYNEACPVCGFLSEKVYRTPVERWYALSKHSHCHRAIE